MLISNYQYFMFGTLEKSDILVDKLQSVKHPVKIPTIMTYQFSALANSNSQYIRFGILEESNDIG